MHIQVFKFKRQHLVIDDIAHRLKSGSPERVRRSRKKESIHWNELAHVLERSQKISYLLYVFNLVL